MACVSNTLIVGGGPAGLTAAVALRLKGVACDLVELTPSGRPDGAALTLMGRAVDAMREIGCYDDLAAQRGNVPVIGDGPFDAAGRPLLPVFDGPPPPLPMPNGAPEFLGLYRPVLSQILTDKARALGANVRFATTVTALEETPEGVRAVFNDGTVGLYDLVVGADGIRSKVRSLVFGDDVRPEFAGESVLRWMAPGPAPAASSGNYYGPRARLIGYHLPHQGLTYVAAVGKLGDGARMSPDEARELMRSLLADFSAPYAEELAKRLTDDQEVIYRPFEWLLAPDPWFRGRVLLIGDAAHATTAHMGQGGGMAIEDAVVLAQELDRASDLPSALAAFMQRRFERAKLVVDTSVTLCRMEEAGATPPELMMHGMPAFAKLSEAY